MSIADEVHETISAGDSGGFPAGGEASGGISRRVRRATIAVAALAEVARERDASQALTRSLEVRCAELEARVAALREALAESSAFNHTVAHELRGRLNGVTGYAELLRHDYGSALGQEESTCLEWLVDATDGMRHLVDDLLLLGESSSGALRGVPVDLSAMAETVAAELRRSDPTRRVAIRIAPGLMAIGDPRLLHVVLSNLLGNAWKYTRGRGAAHIEVGAALRDGEKAYFVSDDGVGFAASRAGELFRPFRRLHRGREFEGTGIGLATVQRIVARHGGRVWAEGEVGRGATFHFTLP